VFCCEARSFVDNRDHKSRIPAPMSRYAQV
jgi:hypothetical protein